MSTALSPTLPESMEQPLAELDAMRRMLEVSQGTFSLSIAVCNSVALRDYLVLDLTRPARFPLVDVSLGNVAHAGVVLAMRITEVEGMFMSSGASIGADGSAFLRVVAELDRTNERSLLARDDLSPERRSDMTALIIRNFLAYRQGVQRIKPAGSGPGRLAPARSGPRVGRNDACPCGSGIKYKKCCGRRYG